VARRSLGHRHRHSERPAGEYFQGVHQIADAGGGQFGLGLGLAIVDRLARLLGHPLDLVSRPGRGSRFSIAVPSALPQAETLPPAPDPLLAVAQPFAGKLVLVIDDDGLVLESMGGLLRNWGCQVSAWTSPAAVLAELFDIHRRPDVIICDYHITRGETGLRLAQRLRSAFGAPIPVLLITGDTSPQRGLEAKAVGFQLLQKPVQPAVLRATLQSMLRSPPAALEPQSSDGAPKSEIAAT
jgi:CheY-like chemotaxis protein